MKLWRVSLAMVLMMASVMGAFWAGLDMKNESAQIVIVFYCICVGILALCFAQDDGKARGDGRKAGKP